MPPKIKPGSKAPHKESGLATSAYQTLVSRENRSVVGAVGLFVVGVAFLQSSWAEILLPA